jgi:hypothetical protein
MGKFVLLLTGVLMMVLLARCGTNRALIYPTNRQVSVYPLSTMFIELLRFV